MLSTCGKFESWKINGVSLFLSNSNVFIYKKHALYLVYGYFLSILFSEINYLATKGQLTEGGSYADWQIEDEVQ